MKKSIIAITVLAGLIACNNAEDIANLDKDVMENVAETVENIEDNITEEKTDFGPVAVNKEEAISTTELIEKFNGKEELEATFKGEITEVCSKMGCWISVKNPVEGEENFMVTFKDHFTIPVDTEIGTAAFLHGTAIKDTVSVEKQRHFLEDAGKTKEEAEEMITEPKITMTFIADGISLPSTK